MDFNLDSSIEILKATPATLDALLRPLSDPWVLNNEGPGSWSPYDIVGHLIHGEETNWIPRATSILLHGETRPFEPFDRFAMFERSRGKSLPELLDRFAELRREDIAELERIAPTPDMLLKRGAHPEFGSVTLGELLSTWVVHDLGHMAQVMRVMAKQYAEAVGPWQAFLPILRR